MDDLISRQAAIGEIREMSPELFSAYQHNVYVDKQAVIMRLMAMPLTERGADVVEVVRCKDCKHYEDSYFCTEHWCCTTEAEEFCSRGERREDEN